MNVNNSCVWPHIAKARGEANVDCCDPTPSCARFECKHTSSTVARAFATEPVFFLKEKVLSKRSDEEDMIGNNQLSINQPINQSIDRSMRS